MTTIDAVFPSSSNNSSMRSGFVLFPFIETSFIRAFGISLFRPIRRKDDRVVLPFCFFAVFFSLLVLSFDLVLWRKAIQSQGP